MWKELSAPPKLQHLTTLQRTLENTTRRLSILAPIVAMPGLLKPTLTLGFRPEHHHELGTGLHQFGIGQHNSAAWKVLKARTDQHQVIVANGAEPSIDDMAKLTVPDGVFLPDTMTMVRGVPCAAEGGPGHPIWSRPPHCAGN